MEHEALQWALRGSFEIGDLSPRLEATCAVAPFRGGTAARWSLSHPAWGALEGTFDFAGRRIFSGFRSADGSRSGVQTLTQKDGRAYLAEGELRRGRVVAWSWALALRWGGLRSVR